MEEATETNVNVIKKDELDGDVKDYASNLEDQLKAELEKSGFDDLNAFVENAAPQDLQRVRELMAALSLVRQSGEIPPTELDEDEFDKAYEDFMMKFHSFALAKSPNLDELYNWFDAESNALPEIPVENFKNDPRYLEKILDKTLKFYEDMPNSINFRFPCGIVITGLYNRSLSVLSLEERNKITQKIELSGKPLAMGLWGSRLDGGRLELNGYAGDYIGHMAKVGIVELDDAGDYLGHQMKGGLISAGRAKDFVGYGASGGTIKVDIAGDRVGTYLNGANIELGRAGDQVGQFAISGEIYAVIAGNEFGAVLRGANLKAKIVGNRAGRFAQQGTITILEEAGDFLGEEIDGATINAKKAGVGVGSDGHKGVITVVEAGNSFGRRLKGAAVKAYSAGDFTGDHAESGSIEVEISGDYTGAELNGASVKVKKAGFQTAIRARKGKIEIREEVDGVGENNEKIREGYKRFLKNPLKTFNLPLNLEFYFKGKRIY